MSDSQKILEQAAERLRQLKPDQFELYLQRATATKIDCKDQKVDSLTSTDDVGLAVRLVKDRRLGFSFTTSLEPAEIVRTVETAFEIARVMPEDPCNQLFSFADVNYPDIQNFDQASLDTPTEKKIKKAQELEGLCYKADPRIKAVRKASLQEARYLVQIMDSNSRTVSHEATLYTAALSAKAEDKGDQTMGWDTTFAHRFKDLDVASVAAEAARTATELLGAGKAPTMACPAVLRNSVVVDLLGFLSGSFSADAIDKGRSLLRGKEGQKIFAESIDLVDDGLLAGGYATSPFDGEGVPSQKTTLVEKGVYMRALYDCYYAKKFGTRPTGHAARGIKGPPSISTTNLFLPAGKIAFDDLMGDITKGILITDLMGLHTANPVTGDFSVGASGILIEDGKLTRPVRGFAVAGNVLELFRRVTEVGSDLRFYGSVGAPSLRISELSVGGE